MLSFGISPACGGRACFGDRSIFGGLDILFFGSDGAIVVDFLSNGAILRRAICANVR